MANTSEFDSLKKWQVPVYFIGLLVAGVMAWSSVVAQTDENEEDIVSLLADVKAQDEAIQDVQTTVTEIRTKQQNIQEDVQEIKADIKLLIRNLRSE
jgi:peptidoglycan hydrolase CwlO-like protein